MLERTNKQTEVLETIFSFSGRSYKWIRARDFLITRCADVANEQLAPIHLDANKD